MFFKTTYDNEFDDLYMHLKAKYPNKLFDLDGIGKQTDMSAFSKNFFSSNVTADASIDSNANVDDVSVIAYTTELPKPFLKLNSYYVLWKELKRLYNLEVANTIVEMQLSGDIYIHDFHGIGAGMPYSYFEKTSIIVKLNNELKYCTMKELYEILEKDNKSHKELEADVINPKDLLVLDENNNWVKVNRILKHKSHTNLVQLETKDGRCTIVTSDHPVITEKGDILAKDLSLNDYLVPSNCKIPFENTINVNEDYAYFIGFLIGDGWINIVKGKKVDIRSGHFFISQEDIKNTKIYQIVNRLFDNVKIIKEDLIRFGHKKDIEKLLDTGFGSKNKKLPNNILSWNKTSIKAMIAGIIDSDGNVNKNGIISIRTISYELTQQLGEICRGLEIGKIRTSFCGKFYSENGYRSNNDIYRLSIRATDKELIKYSEKVKSNKDNVYKKMQKDGRFENNKLHKIIAWETPEYVYDITTETGHFHCQGLIQHNCFNYSTYDIMMKGLPMVKKVKSLPPKYLYAFKSQLEQFTVIASNSTLGATGLADLLVVMSYYVKNILETKKDAHFTFATEEDCWTYIKENLVSFIYTINQPMRANQSPFTNISVYDKYFLQKLSDDYIFPDGSSPDIDIVNKLQDIYLTIMNEELKRTPLTFPVTTACFSIDSESNIKDEKFLKFIAEKNKEFGFINIYCGDSSTLSSCCFDGNQEVLIKNSNGVFLKKIKDIINGEYDIYRKNLTVYHNGSWVKAKPVRIKNKNKLYKITTSNNKELFVTDNHINPTYKGDKQTSELTKDDYILFNTMKLNSFSEKDKNLSYDQGFLIGLYAGDGSKYKRKTCNSYSVTFSLNEEKLKHIDKINNALKLWNIDKNVNINMYEKLASVTINSKNLYDIISEYIIGDYADEKEFNMNILLQSYDFRKGICDGWYASDGGNSNRIYSTSEKLIKTGEAIFTSMGVPTIIDKKNRTGKIEINGEIFNRNYPTISIRWYEPRNKRCMQDIYKIKNNSIFYKIKEIEEYENFDDYVYCFEVDNIDEPYFTLPNGIITHNCRLRSEQKSEYFNSFGSGSSKIGSLGVCSINFPRLAIKNKNDENKFLQELEYMVDVCAKVNNAKRHIVEKRIKNGNEPLYTLGFMELSKQYSTVGVNGLNESLEILGYNILNKDGQEFALKILDVINNANKKFEKKYNAPHNCEQVPAENMSIKMAEKDKLLNYQNEYNIYSNQFIPLVTQADMLDRIKIQGLFDKHFSGGAICHINVDTKIENTEDIMELIRTTAKMGVVYHAINYVLQECKEGHMTVGNKDTCSVCGKPIVNKYTRVVGFLTNVKNWHKVRRTEDFPKRQFYQGV